MLRQLILLHTLVCAGFLHTAVAADWPQLLGSGLRSGNATGVSIPQQPGLLHAIAGTDGFYAAPVIADGTVYAVDGSGVVLAVDLSSGKVRWKFVTKGGAGNCNNTAAPAVIGPWLHVGTTAGFHYVIERTTGQLKRELDLGEPIFSAPAAGRDRVYVATLGAKVHALEADGTPVWQWDFVRSVVGFEGDRWNGADWLKERSGRVTWKDHFVCSRDICLIDRTVVIPAGGRTVFLEDQGANPLLKTAAAIPDYAGNEFPATFGQSADDSGSVYVQWHRRDNAGRLEILKLSGDTVETSFVPSTQTAIDLPGLLSFASASIRDGDIYRVRPEFGLGLCRHRADSTDTELLCPAPSITAPVVTDSHVLYGGLDGTFRMVPLKGGEAIEFATAFGSPISAPAAVATDKIAFGCEDGYLYVLGANGNSPLPQQDIEIWKIRSPLSSPLAGPEFDWYTNYGDFGCTNANQQGLRPPLHMRWARRLEGTVKHLPVCGGGRMYVHTAEGQVIAFEQDTGRLLWRRYWPDVYLSFTSPLYIRGRLLIPQAGIKQSLVRCLDAETGRLQWEAPFTGSPSWSRQFPPVVHGNLAIYASGSGDYSHQGSEKYFIFRGNPEPVKEGEEVMSFIYSNDNPYYPQNHHPTLWAWDLTTGKLVWKKDFSDYGRGGNDCGLCLLDGHLYYSVFFGYSAERRARRGLPPENNGLTACLNPETGDVQWLTTDYYVTAKCTLTGRDGRIYIGGYNQASEKTTDRFVWCLNSADGSLIWKSDPITSALNVVTVGEKFIFSNALRGRGNVFDSQSGKVIGGVDHNYACCRFTMSEPYILGANMDMIDLSDNSRLVSTGPAIDSRECLGAVVSNGRIFYISQASGFVVSQTFGAEAEKLPAVWERR
jgi:outer membrane protein assembly factor BamB